MFFGIRLALTGTLALSAALFTMSEVMAQSPKDADNQETIPIPDIDKCVEIRPIEGGPPVLDCTRAKAGPISFPPVIVGPMYANEDGFTLALVDERSPRGTVYRVTVTDQEMGDETVRIGVRRGAGDLGDCVALPGIDSRSWPGTLVGSRRNRWSAGCTTRGQTPRTGLQQMTPGLLTVSTTLLLFTTSPSGRAR